jgi:hypothetical protein
MRTKTIAEIHHQQQNILDRLDAIENAIGKKKTAIGRPLATSMTTCSMPLDSRTVEIERLREERSFLLAQLDRALCGCVAKDCVKHGAYVADEVDRLRQMRTDAGAICHHFTVRR